MEAILKQTSWLFLAQSITRVIGFFYTIFLAKTLGVAEFGLYVFALAYFSLISSISDFGFNRYLIRELAKNKHKLSELVCNIGMLRLTLSATVFAIFALGLYFLDADKLRVSLTLLAVLAILPQSFALTVDGIFVVLKKLKFSSVSLLISSIVTAFLGLLLVSLGLGAFGAVNAMIFGQLAYLISLSIFLFLKGGFRLSSIRFEVIRRIILGSLPYGLLGILGLLYFRIDTILLAYLRGNFETGLYGVAYRFLEAVVFIPTALGTALFPVMTRLHEFDRGKIKNLYIKSMKIMGFIALLIVFGYITILPYVIKEFLPNYLPSIDAIRILALAIPFMFLHVPASSVILSTDKYLGKIILLSLIPLSFNISMNLIFIPQYGFIAASWITVASDILSFLLIFTFIQRYILKT